MDLEKEVLRFCLRSNTSMSGILDIMEQDIKIPGMVEVKSSFSRGYWRGVSENTI